RLLRASRDGCGGHRNAHGWLVQREQVLLAGGGSPGVAAARLRAALRSGRCVGSHGCGSAFVHIDRQCLGTVVAGLAAPRGLRVLASGQLPATPSRPASKTGVAIADSAGAAPAADHWGGDGGMVTPGSGLLKGLSVTLRTMTRRSITEQYPDVKPELPPRSRGV